LSLCIYKRFGKIAGKLSEIPAFLPLIVSPVTMGTSLILITATRPYIIESWHTLLIAFINAITFLPIGFALVMPRVLDINDHWFFLQESLHCSSVIRIAKIYIPLAKHSISLFLGLIAGFSLSDLTTISVLGYTETPTLPLLVLRQMSNYHFQWASGTALLLVCLCVIVFTIFKRYGTYD
jgi:thiamine transport system permease protein